MLNISIGLLWVISIIQGVVIVALVHQLAELRPLANSAGPVVAKLPIGSRAPEFAAKDLQSNRTIQSATLRGRRTVICFMTSGCYVCRTLAFDLSQKSADELAGLIVCYDDVVETAGTVWHALASKISVLCKEEIAVSEQFHLGRFPVVVVVDEQWRIAGISYPLRADDLLQSLAVSPDQIPETTSQTQLAG